MRYALSSNPTGLYDILDTHNFMVIGSVRSFVTAYKIAMKLNLADIKKVHS